MPEAYDRLPLGALRVFEAVAAHLSFSAAADALHVTPAAVSQQIKMLEGYIQVPLFRRNGRRVEVTEEGLELLPSVRAGLEKLETALQQLKHYRRSGPLQISTLSSFLQIWLLPRVRSFRRKHPDIELRFHTSREIVDFSRKLGEKFAYAYGSSPMMGPAAGGLGAAMKEAFSQDGYPVENDVEVTGVAMAGPMGGGGDASAPFMQMEMQSSNFATGAVDAAKFSVPAGYKEEKRRH